MSQCMTFADEAIDQKDTCTEVATKDIVEIILEEVLLSAVVFSDKGCSRIGDFTITEDFCQQFDQPAYLRVNPSPPATNPDLNLNSGENADHSVSLLTARENLDLILDSLIKREEKVKNVNDCKVISEEVLADNELQIKNGEIHLESNKKEVGKSFLEVARHEYFKKEDIIKDEKIEIEYINDGKINKIYVPLSNPPSKDLVPPASGSEGGVGAEEQLQEAPRPNTVGEDRQKDTERPFIPFATEELRQVWENGNSSSIVGRWDGDMATQPEEVARLMEELSSVQVFPDSSADPNRPRACASSEEDVKKMTKEIEEINFNQSHSNPEEFDTAYHPDGQGDADLESKSFTAKDNSEKSFKPEEFGIESKLLSTNNLNETKIKQSNEKEILNSESKENKKETDAKDCLTESKSRDLDRIYYSGIEEEKIEERKKMSPILEPVTCHSEYIPHEADKEEEFPLNSDPYGESPTESFPYRIHSTAMVMSTISYTIAKGNEDPPASLENGRETSQGSALFPEVITGYQNDLKKSEASSRDFKLNSDKDSKIFLEKKPDSMRGSRSTSNAVSDNSASLGLQLGGGASSLGKLKAECLELYEELLAADSFCGGREAKAPSKDHEIFTSKSKDSDALSFRCRSFSHSSEATIGSSSSTHNPSSAKVHGSLEDTLVLGGNVLQPVEGEARGASRPVEAEEKRISHRDIALKLMESNVNGNECDKNRTWESSSTSLTEPATSSTTGNEDSSDKDSCKLPEKLKLHSPKMYVGMEYDPANHRTNELILTDSQEAFIESRENVIQIIDPSDNSADEDSLKVSFSLLNEVSDDQPPGQGRPTRDLDSDPVFAPTAADGNTSRDTENVLEKKMYSGMTTIGPMKNLDYDPKDLSAPDIDFGKMTRITSSRQLAMDIFGTELKVCSSVKILEEDDSEGENSMTLEGDRGEFASLVNRDIASLTKVQKVREVMSYHPKPEVDFEDDDNLTRSRLDLKDVESMTDERYKVPEMSLPLLTFEVGDNTPETDKEFIQSMQLTLSGGCFNNPTYYEDNFGGSSAEIQRNHPAVDINNFKVFDVPEEKNLSKIRSSRSVLKEKSEKKGEKSARNVITERKSAKKLPADSDDREQGQETINIDSASEGVSSHQKYGTLGFAFKMASNKLICKDGDLLLRSSKSLPRDAIKLTAADSIKSILDDCQSSATNVLKKSRSLLKNTQNIFKTISQGRCNVPESPSSLDKQKPTPSESDICAVKRKLSSLLKKEDLTRAKNSIKSKMEKTFKHAESSPRSEPEVQSEVKDLGVAEKSEDHLQIDRAPDNTRKLLPKSPLVYKSQFVKGLAGVRNGLPENDEDATSCQAGDDKQDRTEGTSKVSLTKRSSEGIPQEEPAILQPADKENETSAEERKKLMRISEEGDSQPTMQAELREPDLPAYIVLETIQGLPTMDLESSSYEPEAPKQRVTTGVETPSEPERGNANVIQMEAPDSLDTGNVVYETSPPVSDKEEVISARTLSEKKSRTKSKKLSARLRNFWCSAFGRVKTPPKNADPS